MQMKDEELKQAQLDRMRHIATALLALATVIFVVARIYEEAAPWVGFVRATAEAAMVGAIADWFAVTALFRYPLGLRIPHTAIVPNRKDQIGRSLGRFVENNFLSHEVLTAKLRSMDVAARLAEWLQDPEHSHRLGGHLAKGLAGAVQVLRDEDVERLIERGLSARIRETEVAPLMGNVLGMVAASELRRELLDGALGLVANLVEENRGDLRERIDREIPWWVPKPIDEKIYRRIVESVERLLDEMRADPDHPLRRRFDEVVLPLRGGAEDLAGDDRARRGDQGGAAAALGGAALLGAALGRAARLAGRAQRRPRLGPAGAAGPGDPPLRGRAARGRRAAREDQRLGRAGAGHHRRGVPPRGGLASSPTRSSSGTRRRPPGRSSCRWDGTCSSSASTAPWWAAWRGW